MKKLALIVPFLIVSLILSAAVVEPERALFVAQSFIPPELNIKKASKSISLTSEIVYIHYMPKSGKPAIYVVNVGEAFALVSADDVAHPILGYNDSKSWPKSDNLPPQVKFFLENLAVQIEAASEHPQDAETAEEWHNPSKRKIRRVTNDNLPESVGPLMTTTWDQGQYYNSFCPEDAKGVDGHVWTGCVATAMAQIINYWGQKEPIQTRGIHKYDSNYGTLEVNFAESDYDFVHMPDMLSSESSQEEITAVAKLMYDCGVALNMAYSPTESAAFVIDCRAALINFFQFSPYLSIAEKADFSKEEWITLLRTEIAAGRPVFYFGRGDNAGHAFVCHGYKPDGYFYFNFGWGGAADGWYQVDAINPMEYLKSGQHAIVGIQPDAKSNVILAQKSGISTFVVDVPLEFYHPMGHSVYGESGVLTDCSSNVLFKSNDPAKQLVLEVVSFENQNVDVYDGEGGFLLCSLSGDANDRSPVVSSHNQLSLSYWGNMSASGFCLSISPDDGCRGVHDISVQNTKADGVSSIILNWKDNSSLDKWEISYRQTDAPMDSETTIIVDSKPVTITGIALGHEYILGVRGLCDNTHYTPWHYVHTIVDLPYWTDVVTSTPSGYKIDASGNIEISSAEGLAWLSRVAKGNTYKGKTIMLTADIDLQGYRWRPIAGWGRSNASFQGAFNGNGHTISNIYVFDNVPYAGLFGVVGDGASFQNVSLRNGQVISTHKSEGKAGGLFASGTRVTQIINCHSNIDVTGTTAAGSLCGSLYDSRQEPTIVANCSATGNVYGREAAGGLIGRAIAINIQNCYALGNVYICTGDKNLWYRGGLIGYFASDAKVQNCYATGAVECNELCRWCGTVIGCPDHNANAQYVYGLENDNIPLSGITNTNELIQDTASFDNTDGQQKLKTIIEIDEVKYENLLDVLNAWVAQQNSPMLRTWVADEKYANKGFPFFSSIPSYTITFVDEDGTILCAAEWEYGTIPNCEAPTKPDDEEYRYTFDKWEPDVEPVTKDAIYTASYIATPKSEDVVNVSDRGTTTIHKILREGNLYILRDGKTYNAQGARVE